MLQDAAIVIVVKQYFFPCYVPLHSYVHNFVLSSSLGLEVFIFQALMRHFWAIT